MNELANIGSREKRRLQLLASASAAALLAVINMPVARAEESSHLPVWIEVGAQVEKIDAGQAYFSPPFLSANREPNPWDGAAPPFVQRSGRYSVGGGASIILYPGSSDWSVSASIRYGRSNRSRVSHQESNQYLYNSHAAQNHFPVTIPVTVYAESKARTGESHTVLDFVVGKDVGLGMFGRHSEAVVSAGIRFAEFTSDVNAEMYGMPGFTMQFGPAPKYRALPSHHQYSASANIARSFNGLGPTMSWKASLPVTGVENNGGLAFDFGLNAALLFGRQKVGGIHNTTGHRYYGAPEKISSYTTHVNVARTRSVVVPNVGGSGGISLHFPNAKISLGYRADFFFGAMDGGIDTRKTYDRDFYGPFATISIGLGG